MLLNNYNIGKKKGEVCYFVFHTWPLLVFLLTFILEAKAIFKGDVRK